ncbi:19409_t:CDS:1, partial [Gigaspora rosea]
SKSFHLFEDMIDIFRICDFYNNISLKIQECKTSMLKSSKPIKKKRKRQKVLFPSFPVGTGTPSFIGRNDASSHISRLLAQ